MTIRVIKPSMVKASDRCTPSYKWLAIGITPGGAPSVPYWFFRTKRDAAMWVMSRQRLERFIIGRLL